MAPYGRASTARGDASASTNRPLRVSNATRIMSAPQPTVDRADGHHALGTTLVTGNRTGAIATQASTTRRPFPTRPDDFTLITGASIVFLHSILRRHCRLAKPQRYKRAGPHSGATTAQRP